MQHMTFFSLGFSPYALSQHFSVGSEASGPHTEASISVRMVVPQKARDALSELPTLSKPTGKLICRGASFVHHNAH